MEGVDGLSIGLHRHNTSNVVYILQTSDIKQTRFSPSIVTLKLQQPYAWAPYVQPIIPHDGKADVKPMMVVLFAPLGKNQFPKTKDTCVLQTKFYIIQMYEFIRGELTMLKKMI